MNKKRKALSVADKIMKVMGEQQKSAEEIKKELKDSFGYSIKSEDIRVNLLYLLRREKIKRVKLDKKYKYYI